MSLLPSLNKFDRGGYWHPYTDHVSYYCLIPKNASSWVSELLMHNQWHEGPIEACPNQTLSELVVVLRDPIERWIAGISQYLYGYVLNSHWYDRQQFNQGYTGRYIPGKLNYRDPLMSGAEFINNYNPVVERILFDQIAFDDHTQSQSWFVNYYNPLSTTWFYLDDRFEKTFLFHYKGYNFELPPVKNYNRGDDNPDIRMITKFLRQQIAEKPYLRNNIERYYKDDYDLLQRANFVYHSDEEINNLLND